MSLFAQIHADLKAARLARTDTVKIEILKAVVNRASTAAKDALRDVTEDDVLEALNYYQKGARFTVAKMVENQMLHDPRLAVATTESQLLTEYLPKKIGDPELLNAIRAIGIDNIGKVMKGLKTQYGDSFDAARAKELFTKETAIAAEQAKQKVQDTK